MLLRLVSLLGYFAMAFICLPNLKGDPAASANQSASALFFQPADLLTLKLSPGGTKICALTRFDNLHFELTLIELATMKTSTLARPARMSVSNFLWKNDDLLLFIAKTDDGRTEFQSIEISSGKINKLPDLDVYPELELINVLPKEAQQMLFRAQRINSYKNDIIRINLKTVAEQIIERDPAGVSDWFTNQAGEAVAALGSDRYTEAKFLLWRANAKDPWQRRELAGKDFPPLLPFSIAPDGRRLVASDYRTSTMGRVCYYDPVTGATEDEIEPAHEVQPGRMLYWGYEMQPGAIAYPNEKVPHHFLNDQMRHAYGLMEKFLPGTNYEFISFSKTNDVVIVHAGSDQNDGGFGLLNLNTGKFTVLGLSRKQLNPAKMSPSREFNFTTSDGVKVNGRITIPTGKKKPPAVVVIGPSLTNPVVASTFYLLDQFFASHGYATVRLNYRGTEGFGRNFATAGDFHIAEMGSDIREGVKWLDAEGWIDGGKVALFANKWGGAIAFPLATQNSPFKVLINFDSVMDTSDNVQGFIPSGRFRETAWDLIGGRLAGEAYAKRFNPLISIPNLSIPSFHHYDLDFTPATTDPANKVKSALKKYKKDYEFSSDLGDLTLIRQNITPWKEKTRQYEAAVAFLDKYLGVPNSSK